MNAKKPKRPFYQRKAFLWSVGSVIGVVLIIVVAFRVSPWPGALVIRTVFEHNSAAVKKALEAHTPTQAIAVLKDQSYRSNDASALLDVYYPENIAKTNKVQPTIIWTHGGAWLSGSKDNVAPYFKLLADKGYTVIALNYSLAPGKAYPAQIFELNDAYTYIQANARRFHVDANQFIFAGDSAGSQLSSQMAALITNPTYAAELAMTPALKPAQLKAVVLYCGIYKMEGLTQPEPQLSRIVGWGNDITVWSYTGTRDASSTLLKQMSPYYHVTKDFPSVFISGGNDDPLTNAQSKPFASELKSLGVDVSTLFYDTDHQPLLKHEYQFDLDNNDGKQALAQSLEFIAAHVKAN
jgi:acetyl esterase/lipase